MNEKAPVARSVTANLKLSHSRLRDVNEQLTLAALGAQEMAEESADLYGNLVQGVNAIVWEAIADPWKTTFVSERAEAILGYPVERWLTEPNFWRDLIHPEDRDKAVGLWKEAASASRGFRLDYRVLASDGRVIWLAMIARLRRHEYKPAEFRGVLLDIGDSVRVGMLQTLVTHQTADLLSSQEQLRALASELNLSEHRERTRLATELHDHLAQLLVLGRLKLGQAKLLLGVVPECGEFIEQTEDVLDESLRYTRTLIADLCPPVLHEFGLLAALRWLAEHMLRYNLTVTIEAPESPLPPIPEGQAVLLFQSVRELLINIAKHARTNQACVTLHCQAAVVRLEVQDAGCGYDLLYDGTSAMAASKSPSSATSKFGLFSIRERMKALGGWFEIKSAPGKGTTAILILPVAANPECSEVQTVSSNALASPPSSGLLPGADRPSPDHGKATIRVLLVDDHAMLRQGLRSIVDGYHHLHVVGEASNGLEAIEAVRQLRPDLVVMDINMPKMNGIEATKHIKEEFPETVVIALSIHEGTEVSQAMKNAGISGYLMKEAAVDELCHAIENAMHNRLGGSEELVHTA